MEDFQSHPRLKLLLLCLAALGFAALLLSSAWAQAAEALKGLGFFSLGAASALFFGFAWRHRLPIKIKGGLSPGRPVFYHLGSAFLLAISLALVATGVSMIRSWLGW